MDLTFKSILEWTKLTVRDPRMASSLVKEANLPLEVSVMIIVLAGVLSGVVSGIVEFILGPQEMVIDMGNGQSVVFVTGPFMEGVYAVVIGLAFAFAVYRIGRAMGGTGSIAVVFSVIAVLQLVMTVLMVAQMVVGLIIPLVGFMVLLFSFYVLVRGLGHGVNVAHAYDSLGRSAAVIGLSFVASVFAVSIAFAVLGIGPTGVVEGTAL